MKKFVETDSYCLTNELISKIAAKLIEIDSAKELYIVCETEAPFNKLQAFESVSEANDFINKNQDLQLFGPFKIGNIGEHAQSDLLWAEYLAAHLDVDCKSA